MSGKIKRSTATKKVMKKSYSERGKVKVSGFNFSGKEMAELKTDIYNGCGLNANYNVQNEIVEVWLSDSGKKHMESRQYFKKVCKWVKSNYKWLITTAVSFLAGGQCSRE